MAGILSLFTRSSVYNEPLPRLYHASCRVGSRLVVQGGRTKDFSEKSRQKLSSVVDIFENYSERWEERPVGGIAPSPGIYGAASTSLHNDLLVFGGYRDGHQFFNTLHKLDIESCLWNLLSPPNADGAPMPKCGSRMISLRDSIGVLGGYGIPLGPTEPHSFIRDTNYSDGIGWTNEFHTYNISQGVWSCPATTGERPPPCSSFSFTTIDTQRAVMFGGYNGEQGRMNDVYILDFSTMNWRKLNKLGDEPWPEERATHAACCLNYGQQFPQLLMIGGLDRQKRPLTDVWILDVERGKWRNVNVTLKARSGHSLTAFSLCPGLTEVMEFGGSPDPLTGSVDKQTKIADTTLLQFRLVESSGQSQWELLSVADNTQLGSPQRMIEKMKLLREDRDRERERVMEVEEEREMFRIALNQFQAKTTEEERMMDIGERLRGMEEERDRLRVELQQSQATANEERDVANQERERANELQRRLDEVEEREHEKMVVQEQAVAAEQRGPSWEVGEDELEVTQNELGRGGWAVVKTATMKVAAKCLYEDLVYDYHRRLFRREMDVAARVSHPNLLRFLGARLEGGMAILTEFMPTSLRALVNRRPRQPIPEEHI